MRPLEPQQPTQPQPLRHEAEGTQRLAVLAGGAPAAAVAVLATPALLPVTSSSYSFATAAAAPVPRGGRESVASSSAQSLLGTDDGDDLLDMLP